MTRSEETKINKIADLVLKLWNVDHLNIVVGYQDDKKFNWIAPTRTKAVLDECIRTDQNLKDAYDKDQDDMALLDEENYYEQDNDGNLMLVTRTEGSPVLLPYDIDDMTQWQLWKLVGKIGEMVQEKNSGKKMRIRWGDQRFKIPG